MHMNISDQEKQDQRRSCGMDDSTAMTVEFLRARLLSERSVSKSARQRADELAGRVAELEEQLRFVSLQRMKAEKATADVLAILESNGMSDVSETFDSDSDQDSPCESKVGHRSTKEEENCVSSNMRRIESESGSDFDFPTVHGRSLSWRGCRYSPCSLDKLKDPSLRRRSSFASTGSSPRHLSGKSCRRIRCNGSRYRDEECKANLDKVDTPENGAATILEDFPNSSNIASGSLEGVGETGGDKASVAERPLSSHGENGENASSNELDFKGYSSKDMEKALEHQAQLIDRYEEMEKAQREWEEKFRETNGGTPDSCDPGNRSDVTEEGYEIKANTPVAPATINANQTQMVKSEDMSNIQPQVIHTSHAEMGSSQRRESGGSTPASEMPVKDSGFTMGNRKPYGESTEGRYHQPLQSSHRNQHSSTSRDCSGTQSSAYFQSNAGSSFSIGKLSESQSELHSLVPYKVPDKLDGVLEALKQARKSLQEKLSPLPLKEGGYVGRSIEPSVLNTVVPKDRLEVPIGCVGLFRLPTDHSVEGNSGATLPGSSTQLSLANYYPEVGVPQAVGSRFVTTTYLDSRPSIPAVGQFSSSRYVECGQRISSQRPYVEDQRPYVDPQMDMNLPISSRYTYPTYPLNPSYPELMQQTRSSTGEGFPTFLPVRTGGISQADRFLLSNNDINPNLYR